MLTSGLRDSGAVVMTACECDHFIPISSCWHVPGVRYWLKSVAPNISHRGLLAVPNRSETSYFSHSIMASLTYFRDGFVLKCE